MGEDEMMHMVFLNTLGLAVIKDALKVTAFYFVKSGKCKIKN